MFFLGHGVYVEFFLVVTFWRSLYITYDSY